MMIVFLIGCQYVERNEVEIEGTDNIHHNDNEKMTNNNTSLDEEDVDNEDETDDMEEEKEEESEELDKHIDYIDEETGNHVVDNPTSIEVYINKQRRLPDRFRPTDLVEPNVEHFSPEGDDKRLMRAESAEALEGLFAQAEEDGAPLVAVSGFRSYERQSVIYGNSVEANGQEYADKYSAKPGYSEHQTGLTMDLGAYYETNATLLTESFSATDPGKWLAENAHTYGFIIRYPEGAEAITGYNYEPWHVRYVGKEMAEEIYMQQITLEEYFGYDYED